MADEKFKTVKVRALAYHTYNGKEYYEGDTYEIDEQLVDSVSAQGKAHRVESQRSQVPPAPKVSHPVAPLSTDNSGLAPKKKP